MAEENQNLTESIPMPEGNNQQNPHSEIMSRDVMEGTPVDAAADWDVIKENLIDDTEPIGAFDIEGLDRAVALHNMVAKFPVSTSPRIKPTNNELAYNEQSTWWDENARMRTQYGKVFRTGFMSTYKSIGDMITGDYMKPDLESAEQFADAMRIGNSTQESGGKFWNNLMLNSGYTVGIMSNIALEEFAMDGLEMATFGGATPLVASISCHAS